MRSLRTNRVVFGSFLALGALVALVLPTQNDPVHEWTQDIAEEPAEDPKR